MCIYLTCSRCGQHQKSSDSDNVLKIITDGWGSFGSALYCPECSKTWGERNSNPMSDSNNTLKIIFDKFFKN